MSLQKAFISVCNDRLVPYGELQTLLLTCFSESNSVDGSYSRFILNTYAMAFSYWVCQ